MVIEEYLPLVRKISRQYMYRVKETAVFDSDDAFQSGVLGLLNCFEKYDNKKGAKPETYFTYFIKGNISDGKRNTLPLKRILSKEKIKQPIHEQINDEMFNDFSIEDIEKRIDYKKIINNGLEKLTEKQRKIIISIFLNEMTNEDIVNEYGMSKWDVEKQKEKGIIEIKKYITENYKDFDIKDKKEIIEGITKKDLFNLCHWSKCSDISWLANDIKRKRCEKNKKI